MLKIATLLLLNLASLPAFAQNYPLHVNAGGESFFNGRFVWENDSYCYGQADSTPFAIYGGLYDRRMYASRNHGFMFNCGNFVNQGASTYDITLYFAEWEAATVGERLFDVKLNDGGNISTLVSNVDVYAMCGHLSACKIELKDIVVRGSAFRLLFVGTKGEAQISGFSIEKK